MIFIIAIQMVVFSLAIGYAAQGNYRPEFGQVS